jgi:hypothetical protein
MYVCLKKDMKIESDELFLIECFKFIIRGVESNNKEKVEYAMDVLSTQLMKFKWTLRRDNFKSTQIAREMLKYCNQASQTSLKGNLIKMRKKLYEIISMISFDDVMDSYRENIDKIVGQLATKVQTCPEELIFDLSGIVTAIDTSTIYRYFLVQFEKKIGMKTLMDTLFKKFLGDQKLLKAIFKLHLRLV